MTLDLSGITLRGLVDRGGPDGERRAVLDGRGVLSDDAIGAGSDLVIEGFVVRHDTANGPMINLGRKITFAPAPQR